MEIFVVGKGRLDLARMDAATRQTTLLMLRREQAQITCTCQDGSDRPNPPLTLHLWHHNGDPRVGIRNLPKAKYTKGAVWRDHAWECPFARHDEGWAAALRADGWRLKDDGNWEATLPTLLPPSWGSPAGQAVIQEQSSILANWALWLLYRARWGRYWPNRSRQLPQRLWHAAAEATINGHSLQDIIWVAGGPVSPISRGYYKSQIRWFWGPAPRGDLAVPVSDANTLKPLDDFVMKIPQALQPVSPQHGWPAPEGHWIVWHPGPKETISVAFLPADPHTRIPVDSPSERELFRAMAQEQRAFARMLVGQGAPDAPSRLRLLGVPGEPEIVVQGDPLLRHYGEPGPASLVLRVRKLRRREDLDGWVRSLPVVEGGT